MESKEIKTFLESEIENELVRIRQTIKGMGEESYLSFKHLSEMGDRMSNNILQNIHLQIKGFQELVEELKNNEYAQELLVAKLKEGRISCKEYAEEQNKLVLQQAKLREILSNLNTSLFYEIKQAENRIYQYTKKNPLAPYSKSFQTQEEQPSLTGQLNRKPPSLNSQKMVSSSYSFSKDEDYDIPDFDQMKNMLLLLKKNFLSKGNILYSGVKIAVERNQDAKIWWDAIVNSVKTWWNISADQIAESGAGIANLFKLDWKAALKNREHSKEMGINIEEDVRHAWDSTFEQKVIDEKASRHNNIIFINNNTIEDYISELEKVQLPLEKQIEILDKIQKLENVNWTYISSDLSDSYRNFQKGEEYKFSTILIDNKDDLSIVEKYFDLLSQGFKLGEKEAKEYVVSIHKILDNVKIGWVDGEKDQFKSYLFQALSNSREHNDRVDAVQSYMNSLKANLPTVVSPPSEDDEEKKSRPIDHNRSVDLAINPESMQPQSVDSLDTPSIEKEIQQQKEYYQQAINEYIKYLKEKRRLQADDPFGEGSLNEVLLNNGSDGAVADKQIQLQNLLAQYQGYTTKMTSLTRSYESDMALLEGAKEEASTEEEKKRIEEAIELRKEGYTSSLVSLEAENAGFSKILFGDLQNISKEALNGAIAEARKFVADWSANAGELSPETQKLIEKIQKAIDQAEAGVNETGGKLNKLEVAEQLRDAAGALQACADLAYVFDESLGDVIQTAADVAEGAADIAMGVASFSANPLQGATSILGGVTKIVGSFGKRMQENEKIRQEYLQGLVETYSKELEYNSVLRERLRIQQQLGETSLDYFNRLQTELNKQQGDINREYTEVWNKLMKENYISGTGYKHGTMFRKAKTWNEYGSLAGKSYEQIESLYTQDKLEGSAKTLFERLRQLKEEGADVVEMMDQLNEEMKESWTGTTTSAITDSIVQGFLDGKRSAADFADTFQDLMKTALMQSVKMKYLEGPLDAWYQKFAEASEAGLTEEKIAELRQQYEQIIENAAREAENMEAITGLAYGAESAREATAQGIASMSQETASELNGNFYALQYLTANIDRNVTNIQSVLYQASDQWIRIEENTRYCRKLETMEKDMSAIRKDMQEISNKGILMRTR